MSLFIYYIYLKIKLYYKCHIKVMLIKQNTSYSKNNILLPIEKNVSLNN